MSGPAAATECCVLELDRPTAVLTEMTLESLPGTDAEVLTHISLSLFDGSELLHFSGDVSEVQDDALRLSPAEFAYNLRRSLTSGDRWEVLAPPAPSTTATGTIYGPPVPTSDAPEFSFELLPASHANLRGIDFPSPYSRSFIHSYKRAQAQKEEKEDEGHASAERRGPSPTVSSSSSGADVIVPDIDSIRAGLSPWLVALNSTATAATASGGTDSSSRRRPTASSENAAGGNGFGGKADDALYLPSPSPLRALLIYLTIAPGHSPRFARIPLFSISRTHNRVGDSQQQLPVLPVAAHARAVAVAAATMLETSTTTTSSKTGAGAGAKNPLSNWSAVAAAALHMAGPHSRNYVSISAHVPVPAPAPSSASQSAASATPDPGSALPRLSPLPPSFGLFLFIAHVRTVFTPLRLSRSSLELLAQDLHAQSRLAPTLDTLAPALAAAGHRAFFPAATAVVSAYRAHARGAAAEAGRVWARARALRTQAAEVRRARALLLARAAAAAEAAEAGERAKVEARRAKKRARTGGVKRELFGDGSDDSTSDGSADSDDFDDTAYASGFAQRIKVKPEPTGLNCAGGALGVKREHMSPSRRFGLTATSAAAATIAAAAAAAAAGPGAGSGSGAGAGAGDKDPALAAETAAAELLRRRFGVTVDLTQDRAAGLGLGLGGIGGGLSSGLSGLMGGDSLALADTLLPVSRSDVKPPRPSAPVPTSSSSGISSPPRPSPTAIASTNAGAGDSDDEYLAAAGGNTYLASLAPAPAPTRAHTRAAPAPVPVPGSRSGLSDGGNDDDDDDTSYLVAAAAAAGSGSVLCSAAAGAGAGAGGRGFGSSLSSNSSVGSGVFGVRRRQIVVSPRRVPHNTSNTSANTSYSGMSSGFAGERTPTAFSRTQARTRRDAATGGLADLDDGVLNLGTLGGGGAPSTAATVAAGVSRVPTPAPDPAAAAAAGVTTGGAGAGAGAGAGGAGGGWLSGRAFAAAAMSPRRSGDVPGGEAPGVRRTRSSGRAVSKRESDDFSGLI